MQPRIKYGSHITLSTKDVSLAVTDSVNISSELSFSHRKKQPTYITKPYEQSTVSAFHSSSDVDCFDITISESGTYEFSRLLSGSCASHVVIAIKANLSVEIIEDVGGSPSTHIGVCEVVVSRDSTVKFVSSHKQTGGAEFSSYRARLEENASLDWFIIQAGSNLSQVLVDSYLVGEYSSVRSYGVYLGKNTQQFDRSDATIHLGNNSTSDMHTRGALFDSSKSIFRGTIDIDANAFSCDGYQKNHTVLLSRGAVADAIPNLEIRNNDVKCSHGATIGRVDEEQLTYLCSRGISKDDAQQMIVEGLFVSLAAMLDWDVAVDKTLEAISDAL